MFFNLLSFKLLRIGNELQKGTKKQWMIIYTYKTCKQLGKDNGTKNKEMILEIKTITSTSTYASSNTAIADSSTLGYCWIYNSSE